MLLHLLFCYMIISPLHSAENYQKQTKRKRTNSEIETESQQYSRPKQYTPQLSRDAAQSNILLLPTEIYFSILSFLSHTMDDTESTRNWARFGYVCKEFQTVSRQWIRTDLTASGEYDLFKKVIRLREIAKKVAEESLTTQEIFDIQLSENIYPTPHGHHSPKRNGIWLEMGTNYPKALATPWGLIDLYGTGTTHTPLGFQHFSARFFSHLKVSFSHIPTCEQEFLPQDFDYQEYILGKLYIRYYASPLSEWLAPAHHPYREQERIRNPTQTRLKEYAGKPIMVYTNFGQYTPVFTIHAIDRDLLESPIYKQCQTRRSYISCKMIWAILQTMLQNETSA